MFCDRPHLYGLYVPGAVAHAMVLLHQELPARFFSNLVEVTSSSFLHCLVTTLATSKHNRYSTQRRTEQVLFSGVASPKIGGAKCLILGE